MQSALFLVQCNSTLLSLIAITEFLNILVIGILPTGMYPVNGPTQFGSGVNDFSRTWMMVLHMHLVLFPNA